MPSYFCVDPKVETMRYIPIFLFLAMLVLPVSAATEVPADPPSVLWIMLDDGRADALGSYGSSWALTPHMDRIASAGIRFESARLGAPMLTRSDGSPPLDRVRGSAWPFYTLDLSYLQV